MRPIGLAVVLAVGLSAISLVQIATAGLDEGLAAYRSGDYQAALRELQPLAENGVPEAQQVLGIMHADGKGVPEDGAEAFKWMRRAAEQGLAQAQLSLASMYSVGDGVGQDYVLAYMWCTLSDAGSGVRRCDRITSRMTKEQVDRAKELASKFVSRQERDVRPPTETVR